MIFGKTKMELQVGIFVFIGLVILVTFVLSIGSFKTWTSGYKVNFIFNFVNGVKVGAPVRFSGVDAGEVKKINFIPPSGQDKKEKIEVVCWLKRDINIPKDSTVWVNTLGLLGEKYIEIMPGSAYDKPLATDESIEGVDPIPMHEIFRIGKGVVDTINDAITKIKNKEGTLGKLLFDDQLYYDLDDLVIDLRNNPWKVFWKGKEVPLPPRKK